MPREADPTNIERAFILDALSHNIRLDGRAFDQLRPLELSFEGNGAVIVLLGKTRVYVQISAEVTKPLEERKFDGIFTITTELSPIASPAFEVGRQTEQEVILSRILEKAVRRSNAIDTESLCIVAGSKCWSIRADIHVLDFDGALIDASGIALLAALRHFRRPDVSVDGQEVTIYKLEERVPVPLSILHHPICITFSIFHGGSAVLIDATLREEQVREGEITITMNQHGEICQIAKLGGVPCDASSLLKCIQMAAVKVRDIDQFVSKKLEMSALQEDVGSLIAELVGEHER